MLEVVTDNVNSRQQDSDPAQWLPPRENTHCDYAVRWVAIKYGWDLSVDANERAALEQLLSGTCAATIVAPPGHRDPRRRPKQSGICP